MPMTGYTLLCHHGAFTAGCQHFSRYQDWNCCRPNVGYLAPKCVMGPAHHRTSVTSSTDIMSNQSGICVGQVAVPGILALHPHVN
jgi:hypothetical protein